MPIKPIKLGGVLSSFIRQIRSPPGLTLRHLMRSCACFWPKESEHMEPSDRGAGSCQALRPSCGSQQAHASLSGLGPQSARVTQQKRAQRRPRARACGAAQAPSALVMHLPPPLLSLSTWATFWLLMAQAVRDLAQCCESKQGAAWSGRRALWRRAKINGTHMRQ